MVHLVKLCVGIDEVSQLARWYRRRLAELKATGEPAELGHTTRQMPRRRDDILDGGSLYWVIRGVIQVRQAIGDLRPVTGEDGIVRCRIVLADRLIATRPVPRRPFQGWRYLEAADAPPDIAKGTGADLPPALVRELADLGLL